MDGAESKPVHWIGSTLKDLRSLKPEVREQIGHALWVAQRGGIAGNVKPLKGFGGAGILEIVVNFESNTYRGVYTVRFAKAVYALHAFMKKSKTGIKTPLQEIELIKTRLRVAEQHYTVTYGGRSNET